MVYGLRLWSIFHVIAACFMKLGGFLQLISDLSRSLTLSANKDPFDSTENQPCCPIGAFGPRMQHECTMKGPRGPVDGGTGTRGHGDAGTQKHTGPGALPACVPGLVISQREF